MVEPSSLVVRNILNSPEVTAQINVQNLESFNETSLVRMLKRKISENPKFSSIATGLKVRFILMQEF